MNKTLDIKIKDRIAKLELLNRNENKVEVKIDETIYSLDIQEVEKGVYSILKDGRSYNLELVQKPNAKEYEIHSQNEAFDVEIIDAETKYMMSRGNADSDDGGNSIASPMPGKVIKILVNIGDEVKEGTTVIIVEAMKMQSEYKVKADRRIVDILVKEGDAIDSNQALIIVE
jgi:biotin carboxyl carrier protein